MREDKNNYSGAFGNFYGDRVAEPKNITSDMWTPISVAPAKKQPDRKYVPENNREPFRHSPPPSGKSVQGNRQKADKRQPSQKVASKNQNRSISQGREQQGKGPDKGRADNRNKHNNKQKSSSAPVNNRGAGKKNPTPKKQQPSGQRPRSNEGLGQRADARQNGRPAAHPGRQGAVRGNEPKASHARQPMSQREYAAQLNNKKDVRRSNDAYEQKRDKGASHNEIMSENSAQKKKKRKIRNIISNVMAVVFVAAFIAVYSYSKGAPVQKVVVEGDSVYTSKQVIYVSGIRKGDNMLGIKKKQVCADIETKLPYIYEASVDFKLPDTVTITVVPTTEKILINNKNNYICIDDNNKIVSLKKKKLTKGLYRVDGMTQVKKVAEGGFYVPIRANKEKFDLAKQIVSCLEQSGLISNAVINVEDLTDVQVTYDSRICIYLGKCEDVEAQLSLAAEAIKHSASAKQKGYIDMRYSNTAYFNEGSMVPA